MRIVSYGQPGDWASGFQIGQSVVDIAEVARHAGWPAKEVGLARSNRALLELGSARLRGLEAHGVQNLDALRENNAVRPLSQTRLGPPIPDPRKIICIGLNYYDHAEEIGVAAPQAPIFFAKFDNSLVGPTDEIVPPADTQQVDYEAELAAVVGRRGRYIAEKDALDHIFGAMAFNDVSARDLQLANQLWTGGKAIDTFGPCGPALVSRDEIGDLHSLGVRTRVDGRLMQNGSTASMIFGVAKLVSFLSRIMTLEPGDIIATGTPSGVGLSQKPPLFLQTGAVVEVEIEGIGMLRNTIAAPS